MNQVRRELDELGRHLWPSTESLQPHRVHPAPASHSFPRVLGAVVIFAATAAAIGGILAVSLLHREAASLPSHSVVISGPASSVSDIQGDGFARRIGMVNAAAGWVWGPAYVGRTTDALQSIVDVTPSTVTDFGNYAVGTAIDANDFWLVSTVSVEPGAEIQLLRTNDGGANWDESSFQFAPGIWSLNPSAIVSVASSQLGWIEVDYRQGGGFGHFLFESTDGGSAWKLMTQTILPVPASAPPLPSGEVSSGSGIPSNCALSGLYMQSIKYGYATATCGGTGFTVLVTTTGGAMWTTTPAPPWAALSTQVTPAIALVPNGGTVGNKVLALSLTGEGACQAAASNTIPSTFLYTSSDGGSTWSQVGSATEPGMVYYGLPSQQALLVPTCAAPQGTPLVSSDGGSSWTLIFSWPAPLLDRSAGIAKAFDVSGAGSAFALSFDITTRVTTYYASSNGGATFQAVNQTGGGTLPNSSPSFIPVPPTDSATSTSS